MTLDLLSRPFHFNARSFDVFEPLSPAHAELAKLNVLCARSMLLYWQCRFLSLAQVALIFETMFVVLPKLIAPQSIDSQQQSTRLRFHNLRYESKFC